ncbi:unnamed protein product [Macrosiphum euphorbiae]|uniref:Uncharacterized protein n=1 Tax=Macrosiphum euphorbiae TaxID=13131 RepID=A0AAV0Y7B3_9HEMI|nr:unnamed protein product [Macrosiphum euphorbiae]
MKRSLPSQSSIFNFFHNKTNQTELDTELITTEEVPCASTIENGAIETDETCDISRIEQMSLCVKYIEDCSIREDFLTFIPIYDASGNGLARTIMIEIEKLGLKKENCSEDRLTVLALLSVHRGIQIDIEEIINTFSRMPRKVDFVL